MYKYEYVKYILTLNKYSKNIWKTCTKSIAIKTLILYQNKYLCKENMKYLWTILIKQH